ncbi:hypothetical protein F5884DRAFT_669119 [Xylogone sp. PMI_703]|nr:hypothetical protein F5884DRAFT_669119 [Xylogone sp. PMI_703]
MKPSEFRVAIVGGGIGGLSCALSLAHHCPGLNIDVYEQAPQYSEIGAGVGIAVNAAKILHRLGVGKEANAISGERNGVHRTLKRWDNGGEIVTIGADFEEGEIRQLSVHRAELLEVLFNAVKERGLANLHVNKRLNLVLTCSNLANISKDAGDKVIISFEDGTEADANFVVGCDGIHSRIRGQFMPDKPRYSGRIVYRGLLPLEKAKEFWPYETYAVSWLGKDKHFLVFPISQNKTLNVVGFISKPLEELGDLRESWSSTAPREEIEAEYEGWDPTVLKIIKCMQPRPGKWLLNDRELLSQWVYFDGKLALLGDAAHAMLPHQGSGAGHAIEDGYILGKALQDFFKDSEAGKTDLSTWAHVYQNVRLPRAQKAQITSRQAGEVYEMQGELFKGLTFDECLPIVAEKLKTRMRWVWGADIDAEYDVVVKRAGLRG